MNTTSSKAKKILVCINWKQFQWLLVWGFLFHYYPFHGYNCPMIFVIFRSYSDNFEVKFCLILLIISFTLGKYGEWMRYWFYQHGQGNVCMKMKIGKFIRMICLIHFAVGLLRKMQNRDFLVCYGTFPREKVFLRKKSRLVGVRWFLFFSVIDFKSPTISF